jgi:translation initiation factor IF-1
MEKRHQLQENEKGKVRRKEIMITNGDFLQLEVSAYMLLSVMV